VRPAYAELHARSNFSFLCGASHPEELAERAATLGYSALAVTDECSLAGVVRAHVAAGARGLPLIVGSEVALTDGPRLVLLATDREGYGGLSDLITRGRRREAKGRYRLNRDDLEGGLPGCLALLVPEGPDRAMRTRRPRAGSPRPCRGGPGWRWRAPSWRTTPPAWIMPGTWGRSRAFPWWPRAACGCTCEAGAP